MEPAPLPRLEAREGHGLLQSQEHRPGSFRTPGPQREGGSVCAVKEYTHEIPELHVTPLPARQGNPPTPPPHTHIHTHALRKQSPQFVVETQA